MRSGLLAIMQKELRRFFTDRRMVITTVILPGLLIYLIYSFMGSAMTSNLTVSSDYEPQVYALNLPESLEAACTEAGLPFESITANEVDHIKERLAAKEADLLAVFPKDFDAQMAAYLGGAESAESASAAEAVTAAEGAEEPTIELFYNSTRVESSSAYSQMQALLDSYKESIQPLFSVNRGEGQYDQASEEDTAGFMFASLLPMLLMLFLYSGCMAVAPESIAGEKERGTIATLLVTPLKRWEFALGKILSLCIIALLAGASSFIGVMLSLPNLMGMASDGGGDALSVFADTALYGPQDYLMLLLVILSTVVLFVGLISVISAFARTIKEASTMVMPLMMVVLLVGATAMFQTSSETILLLYLVPVYNSVQSMVAIFSFSADPAAIALTVAVNLVISAVCVVALTRMFESERIVFNK